MARVIGANRRSRNPLTEKLLAPVAGPLAQSHLLDQVSILGPGCIDV
jgi:hypothetical protein